MEYVIDCGDGHLVKCDITIEVMVAGQRIMAAFRDGIEPSRADLQVMDDWLAAQEVLYG